MGIMNGFMFMLCLAFATIALSSPVKPKLSTADVVPETPETNLANEPIEVGRRRAEMILAWETHSSGAAKVCKSPKKVRWYTNKFSVSALAPNSTEFAIKNAAIDDCKWHCTQNLQGHEKCSASINERLLTEHTPYKYNAQCDCKLETASGSALARLAAPQNKSVCKTGRVVRWYTNSTTAVPTTSDDRTIKDAAIKACNYHCTEDLNGHKKCGGTINERRLTEHTPYKYNAQCNCNSAFKAAAISIFAMVVVIANVKILF